MVYAAAAAPREAPIDTVMPTEGLVSGLGGLASIVKNYDKGDTFSNKATANEPYAQNNQADNVTQLDSFRNQNDVEESTAQAIQGLDGLTANFTESASAEADVSSIVSNQGKSVYDSAKSEESQNPYGSSSFSSLLERSQSYSSESSFVHDSSSASVVLEADNYCCPGCDAGTEHISGYGSSSPGSEQSAYSTKTIEAESSKEFDLTGLAEKVSEFDTSRTFSVSESDAASVVLEADNYCCPGCDTGTGHQSSYTSPSNEPVVTIKENLQSNESAAQATDTSSNITFDFSTGIDSLTTEPQAETTSSNSAYSSSIPPSTSSAHYESKQGIGQSVSTEKISPTESEKRVDLDEVVSSLDNADPVYTEHSVDQRSSAAYVSSSASESAHLDATVSSHAISEENYSGDTHSLTISGNDSVIMQYASNDNATSSSDTVNPAQEQVHSTDNQSPDSRIDLATIVTSEAGEGHSISFSIDAGDSVLAQYASNDATQESISHANYQTTDAEAIADKIGAHYQSNEQNVGESIRADSGNDLSMIVSSVVGEVGESHSVVLESGDSVLMQYAVNDSRQGQQNVSDSNYKDADVETISEHIASSHSSRNQQATQSTHSDSAIDLSTVVSSINGVSVETPSIVVESGDSVLVQYATKNRGEPGTTYQGEKRISSRKIVAQLTEPDKKR